METINISAIILAAGESKRMGQPKMLLPWGKTTVLMKVINTFKSAGIQDIIVITGGKREEVERLVGDSARTVFNENFATGEMLSSVQCGLNTVKPKMEAALICLGDQPQVEERSVRLIVEEYLKTRAPLIVPSYQMRRGHPWLVAKKYWDEILKMRTPESPREFLNRHAVEIHYLELDTPSILQDLDTPEDYARARP